MPIINRIGGGSGGPSFSASLKVYANNGSTVTAVNGNKTVTGTVSGGAAYLSITRDGIWIVTANDGTYSGTDTISITEETSYTLDLDFKQNYQEVEYLRATGTQYIDTLISPTTNTIFEVEGNFDRTTSGQLFGCVSGGSTNYGRCAFGIDISSSQYTKWYCGIGEKNYWTTFANDNNRHKFVVNVKDGNFELDDISYFIGKTFVSNDLNIFLFARNTSALAEKCYFSLTKSAIKRDNLAQRLYTPCYKKSNNIAGLYDKVSKTLFTNSGSGTFIVGPDVA